MVGCISVRKGDVHNNVGIRFTRYISAKSCFELIAQSPYSACQATAAMQQDFAEYIIKFRYLFRADNICPYGWHAYHILFDVVRADNIRPYEIAYILCIIAVERSRVGSHCHASARCVFHT